jgi:hypothetical protein
METLRRMPRTGDPHPAGDRLKIPIHEVLAELSSSVLSELGGGQTPALRGTDAGDHGRLPACVIRINT